MPVKAGAKKNGGFYNYHFKHINAGYWLMNNGYQLLAVKRP